jgi:hypothetical protein
MITFSVFFSYPLFYFAFYLIDFFPSVSPSKDYGVRASSQLHSLRTLLERRLMEDDDTINHPVKDSSILQSSPGTFTKDFLQSYQGLKYKKNPTDLVSDLDDDDQNQQIKINYNRHDVLSSSSSSSLTQQYQSSVSDDVKQDKVHSNGTLTSTSNFSTKIVSLKRHFNKT